MAAARDLTPYGQTVEDNIAPRGDRELERRCDYAPGRRRSAPSTASPVIKRGIALTPVKFGISFTATW
jgi:xanthine dehydrogenase large subunit